MGGGGGLEWVLRARNRLAISAQIETDTTVRFGDCNCGTFSKHIPKPNSSRLNDFDAPPPLTGYSSHLSSVSQSASQPDSQSCDCEMWRGAIIHSPKRQNLWAVRNKTKKKKQKPYRICVCCWRVVLRWRLVSLLGFPPASAGGKPYRKMCRQVVFCCFSTDDAALGIAIVVTRAECEHKLRDLGFNNGIVWL